MTDYLTTPEGRRIAHHRTPGRGPGVVFMGGFRSDMTGTKAVYLEERARIAGRAFLRFDYSGHGESSGTFEEGCIGDWAADAMAAVAALTEGPQVIVGSSMGGWIALLLARAMPDRVIGLVGVAAAPDFTEDLVWAGLSDTDRAQLMAAGRVERASAYADGPYVYTRRLIEDGRRHLVLRDALDLPMPVRLVQGTADTDVPPSVALRLMDHANGPDIRLTLIKGADHRLSSPGALAVIGAAVDDLCGDNDA
ncbi:MAG: alpha/beta hydrolase [Paracoccaceae bacterium]|nr:MAG: alpha/beta hydrolase [Paracoccaceae bacterium]